MKVLVYDWGLFFYVAERIAREGHEVFYFSPRTSNFPTPHFHIGSGFEDENIKRVDDFFSYVDEADLIVFTDVNDADIIKYLRGKGKLVFGAGEAEELELDRLFFREVLEKLQLPYAPYKLVHGVDELREYMQKHKDVFIKISFWRGVKETFHHVDWDTSEEWWYSLAKECGAKRNQMEFIVEQPFEGVETGTDWFFSNGKFADMGIQGFEVKNKAYLCKLKKRDELPKILIDIDNKFAPVYKKMGAMGTISTEVRVKDKNTGYYSDACMRFGSPPGELTVEMYGNFTEMLLSCAKGKLAEVEPDYLYGASIFLLSDEVREDYLKVKFPEDVKDFVKLRAPIKIGKDYYVTPQEGANSVGNVIGLGDTMEEAIEMCLEIAEQVEADGLTYDANAFDKEKEYLKKAEKFGVQL